MITVRKFHYFGRLLKLTSDCFNVRQYFVTFSLLHSDKFRLTNTAIILHSYRLILKRKYMDLSSVIKIFENEVPPYLAEKWDNTGLLLESSNTATVSSILFTIDLTENVLEEAIGRKSELIISYHPPIFSPIKSLQKSNWKDRMVVKCIQNAIAVYSPHTSCDAVAGGVNDWLISCFDLSECRPIQPSYEPETQYSHIVDCNLYSNINIHKLLSSVPDTELCSVSTILDRMNFRVKVTKTSLNHIMKVLNVYGDAASISVTAVERLPIPSCGMGRIGKLATPLTLNECVFAVKRYLNLGSIRFAQSPSQSRDSPVSTVAVCAGSGSTVLKGISADLYITGEMSHHDLLDANHRNVSVVLCEHSNSERGYLRYLASKLSPKLPGINLFVSESDRDPISIV